MMNNSTIEEEAAGISDEEISTLIKKISLPIVLVLGIIGNSVSIIIFSRKSLRKYTTFYYLLILSVLDIVVLIAGSGDQFTQVYFNFDIRLVNVFWCKFHSFLVYWFTHSSSMILMCMSIDRAVVISSASTAVPSPSSHKWLSSTPWCAFRVFCSVMVVTFLINVPLLISMDIHSNPYEENATDLDVPIMSICNVDEKNFMYFYMGNINPWVDILFYAILPSTVMLICSMMIIYRIFSASRNLRQNAHLSKKRFNKNKQISYLLLTTNLLFFCLVTPLLVLIVFRIDSSSVLVTVVYTLAYSNHGLNFIFYGITCEKYQIELLKLFSKATCKSRELINTELRTIMNNNAVDAVDRRRSNGVMDRRKSGFENSKLLDRRTSEF